MENIIYTQECNSNNEPIKHVFNFNRLFYNDEAVKQIYNEAMQFKKTHDKSTFKDLRLYVPTMNLANAVVESAAINEFVSPYIASIFQITEDVFIRSDIFGKFVVKYLHSILSAECNRMISDNIDYTKEKPFIIVAESAISRMLRDDEFMYKFRKEVNAAFRRFHKKSAIKTYNFNSTNSVIRLDKMPKSGTIVEMIDEEKDIYHTISFLEFDDFGYNSLRYFSKIYLIDLIKEKLLEEFTMPIYTDDIVNRIKSEITISFVRNAGVFSEYLTGFKHKFNPIKYDKYNVITELIENIHNKFYSREEFIDYLNKNGINKINEDIISERFASLYMGISSIEALNRNYAKYGEPGAGVDCEKLRELFNTLVMLGKQVNLLQNKFYGTIISGEYFNDKKTPERDQYYNIQLLLMCFINNVISNPNNVGNETPYILIQKDSDVCKIIDAYSPYHKSKYFKSHCKNIDVWEDFIKLAKVVDMEISQIVNSYRTTLEEFNKIVNEWIEMMEENIEFNVLYDPIKEYRDYMDSDRCLCSINYHTFSNDK